MITPKAVLFDFDGVVVDSFNVHYDAWSQAFFKLFKKEMGPFPEVLEGKSPREISAYWSKVGGDREQASALFELKGDLLHRSKTPPNLLPGVKELTQFLKAQNIPYGIASNATKQYIENSIKQLEIDFSTFFGIEDYKFPKPNPEPYQMLAKALGVTKNDFKNVIVFEDSITGVTAAKNAGMIPIGIQTQNSSSKLKAAGCRYSFSTLSEALLLFQ